MQTLVPGQMKKRELDCIRKNVGLMNAEKIYGYLKKTKESEIDRLEKISVGMTIASGILKQKQE